MTRKHLLSLLLAMSVVVFLVGCRDNIAPVPATAEPATPQPTPGPTLGESVDAGSTGLEAARAAGLALAADLNVSPADVVVENIRSVTWPNGCLGVQRMGVLCANIVSDGYAITFSYGGRTYQVNTNGDGSSLVRVPDAATGDGTADAPTCTLTALADVTVYQRPSVAASQFGTLSAGDTAWATMRTPGGWLGFDPAVAQAANMGVFRLRWVAPDAAVTADGDCAGLPVAPSLSPTACYFMALADTAAYTAPDTSSVVLAIVPVGGYTAVTGQDPSGWYQLDLQDGSLAQAGSGWLNPADANFNGACDGLPAATP